MTCLYMVTSALFIVAAIISFVLSLLGVLFVGALRLIPIVMLVLAVAVLLGKVKISIVHVVTTTGARSAGVPAPTGWYWPGRAVSIVDCLSRAIAVFCGTMYRRWRSCRSGGIGRRSRLKICRWQQREFGSLLRHHFMMNSWSVQSTVLSCIRIVSAMLAKWNRWFPPFGALSSCLVITTYEGGAYASLAWND